MAAAEQPLADDLIRPHRRDRPLQLRPAGFAVLAPAVLPLDEALGLVVDDKISGRGHVQKRSGCGCIILNGCSCNGAEIVAKIAVLQQLQLRSVRSI